MKIHLTFLTLALCVFATNLHAANNPLNTTKATDFDGKSPGIKLEDCKEGGKDLCSIHDGDYAVYKALDFDSGVAAFQMHYAGNNKGTVEIHLDSLTGPLMGTCPYNGTGGWQVWSNVGCNVDNSQATVRDVYLVFHGETKGSLLNVASFIFLKSVVITGQQTIDLSGRLDVVDNEPQGTKAWGMPETGFKDDFEDGTASHWTNQGMTVTTQAITGSHSLAHTGAELGMAFTPDVYINKTDTGGEWRTLAEGSVAADIVIDSADARPGIGFASKDGKQYVEVVLNPTADMLEVYRQLTAGAAVQITTDPKPSTDPDKQLRAAQDAKPRTWHLKPGAKYRLQVDYSPYSNGLIAFLYDETGGVLTSLRTVVDLPVARRPLLIATGAARFDNVVFDPTLDGWNYKWEWKKEPVLYPDVCNPAVWRGKDGKIYMMWRKFGADTYHGVASSPDGVNWTRVSDQTIKTTGDMNVVVNPFGDGLLYITPGGGKMSWWTSDGSNNYTNWIQSTKTTGDIFGNCRIQDILDTKRYPQMAPIAYNGATYRFVAFTEDWGRMPRPHTVVLLSNTLTDWVLPDPDPVLPPGDNFWGERGNAIGASYPLPDGNILLGSCSCTNAGYTGAPEPSNVSVIVDGKQPWKTLKVGVLPDAPVSREAVWYQGPNFGTAYFYDETTDTLFYYGGFHDYNIGVLRVRHFLHPEKS